MSFTCERGGLSVDLVLGLRAWEAIAAGVAFGLSLIVAIGPQNAYVLVQGVHRRHVGLVVGTCALSDVLMIGVGVTGAGAALAGRPEVARIATAGGVAFLLGYGAFALRRALRPAPREPDGGTAVARGRRAALLSCLAFTWLNPGVYVDTVFLVGPVAVAHGGQRWTFAAGAMVASVGWFVLLGYGARFLRPALRRPGAWRVLDLAVATVMAATATRLVLAG
jgi:L-lysine exporter family protein LysE/ArgO